MLNYCMQYLIKLIQKTYRMVDPQEGKTILNNVLSLSSLQAISYILPIAILPYLFRILGPEKFGLIAFAQAFVQYFMILTDYGFSVSATKSISLSQDDKDKTNEIISAVMTIKVMTLLISAVILSILISIIPKFNNDWLVYVISFGAVIGNSLFPMWYFQGTENMKPIAKINIIGEFIYAIGIIIFIKTPNDYLMLPVITSFVAVITGLWGQYLLFKHGGMVFKLPNINHLKSQLSAGWDVFISVVAINAYTNTRIFAVGLLTNNSITGFYSIAERIANTVQTFPLSSFAQAIFPRLSKIYNKNKLKAFQIMQEVQKITTIFSLICIPIIFFLSPMIINLVCGGQYNAAIHSLKYLLISVFFIASNAFRVQFLLVAGETKTYSRIHITMATLGLPTIILFIYSFSYVGAAIATTAIEAGVLLLTYIAIRKLKFS